MQILMQAHFGTVVRDLTERNVDHFFILGQRMTDHSLIYRDKI